MKKNALRIAVCPAAPALPAWESPGAVSLQETSRFRLAYTDAAIIANRVKR